MPSADNQFGPMDETAIAKSIEAPDQPTAVAPALPRAQPTAQDDTLAPGSIFHGDFRISESIAKRGGMGEVYRATNTINNSVVAIKMIRSDLSHDPELVNKFIQEDEALRQLNNPAVVRYYGVRKDPASGRYYIQMEYVDGPTLGEYVREHGAVPAPEAKALCRHLALGLEDAHRSGIVHRDISPDNVLLGDSALQHAKIIDFGIAKVASTGDFTTFRTSFVGKYRYASPEHFSASAPIDQRSDIYSLGLVIAAAAAGKPLEMGRDELSGATARLTVPDLSPVPAALRPMLTRMLDPDPMRRPTAAELVVELADRKERPDGGGGQVLLWLGLVAAVMTGGAGGAYWLKHHPEILASLNGHRDAGNAAPVVFGPKAGGTEARGSETAASLNTAGGSPTALGDSVTPAAGTTADTASAPTVYQPTVTGNAAQTAALPSARPAVPFKSVQEAVTATPGACTKLEAGELGPGRALVSGLIDSDADADRMKAAVEGLSYVLDDQAVVSAPTCQTLQLLAQLGRVNALTGANRPVLSVQREPAVFRRGETAAVQATVSLIAPRHLYWIKIDGAAGTAVVQHETSGTAYLHREINDTVAAPGWDLVLVLVAPHELKTLNELNQTTVGQLNIALESEIAKPSNRHEAMSAAEFVRRIE